MAFPGWLTVRRLNTPFVISQVRSQGVGRTCVLDYKYLEYLRMRALPSPSILQAGSSSQPGMRILPMSDIQWLRSVQLSLSTMYNSNTPMCENYCGTITWFYMFMKGIPSSPSMCSGWDPLRRHSQMIPSSLPILSAGTSFHTRMRAKCY